MKRSGLEAILGFVVLGITAYFFLFAYKIAGLQSNTAAAYLLKAKFDRIDGISPGSEVRIGGIKVGTVVLTKLDDYRPVVHFNIDKNIKLSQDSTAKILSDGLLGGKFISIEPGNEETMLEANGLIEFTQSSVNLEDLIGKFMFSGGK